MLERGARAFTLVEILIVVVILGIVASIVVPKFASATEMSSEVATLDQLTKLRRALAVYNAQHSGAFPQVTAGDGTWGELIPLYMRQPPVNAWVSGANSKVIVIGDTPDTDYQTTYAWVYNPATGEVWAGSFDADDRAIPRR